MGLRKGATRGQRSQSLRTRNLVMAQNHHNALANAADHIREVTQRADEVQKLHERSSDQVQTLAAEPNTDKNCDKAASSKPVGRVKPTPEAENGLEIGNVRIQ